MRSLLIEKMGSQPADGVRFVVLNEQTFKLLPKEIDCKSDVVCPFCGKGVLILQSKEDILTDMSDGKKITGRVFRFVCSNNECSAVFTHRRNWLSVD